MLRSLMTRRMVGTSCTSDANRHTSDSSWAAVDVFQKCINTNSAAQIQVSGAHRSVRTNTCGYATADETYLCQFVVE